MILNDKEKGVVKQVLERLKDLIKNAYAPYSNYSIACVVETDDGSFFQGVNIENASYPVTLCAERSAIGSMIACNSSKKIRTIYLYTNTEDYATPCGMCRQFISEFSDEKTNLYIFNKNEEILFCLFNDLLPMAFSKDKLKNK